MSAFCFSPEIIDLNIYQLWLRGLTIAQTTSVRDDADQMLRDVLEIDTADHFRLFEELQPSLEEPRTTMCLLDIPMKVRFALSESFYSFDDIVVREFLGRKFTSRVRRDLDEVSDITATPRRSCLRQFDNLKRIFDAGDEVGFQIQYPVHSRVADVLRVEFLISRSLMARYEAVLFLMHHRFNVPSTGRKKIASVALRDLEFCALTILNAWCVKAPAAIQQVPFPSSRNRNLEALESPQTSLVNGGANFAVAASSAAGTPMAGSVPHTPLVAGEFFSPFDLDAALFTRFRDFRLRANQYHNELWSIVANSMETTTEKRAFENKFKPWFRALLLCATGRDLRDFFDDLLTAVIEPLTDMRVDVEKLFDALDRAIIQTFSYADASTWNALMSGIRPCVTRLMPYHQRYTVPPAVANAEAAENEEAESTT